MWKNYLKIALRNFRLNIQYSLLNIIGLSIGLSTAFLSLVYVNDELSFDDHHTKATRIFRIAHQRNFDGSFNELATTPLFLARFLEDKSAGIKQVVRFVRDGYGLMKYEHQIYSEPQFAFVDVSVFEVFDYSFVSGSPRDFKGDDVIMISDHMAKKYFGNESAIGKIITREVYGRQYHYQVAGVYENNRNTHFHFDFLVPFESNSNGWNGMHGKDWFLSYAWTYLLLEDEHAQNRVGDFLSRVVAEHMPESLKEGTNFYLQPLQNIYLQSDLQNEIEINGRLDYVLILLSIGLITLFIACINYINLSTSKVLNRAKEVAMRKTFGSSRREVMIQFFTESSLYTLLSLMLSLLIVMLLLPGFNELTGKQFVPEDFISINFILLTALIYVSITVLSGTYPAFYMSGFKPIDVFRRSRKGAGFLLREVLVMVQFLAVVICVSGIFIIRGQLEYLKNKELGFDASRIIYLDGYRWRDTPAVKQEAAELKGVLQVSVGSGVPSSLEAPMLQTFIRLEGKQQENRIEAFRCWADEDYFELLGIDLLKGRMPSFQTENNEIPNVVINESLLRLLDDPESVIGAKVELFDFLGDSSGQVNVIGVVSDFHIESLRSEIKPMIFSLTQNAGNLIVRVEENQINKVSEQLLEIAKKYPAETLPGAYLLKQDLDSQYAAEDRLYRVSGIFTFVAMLVAALGLYGLTSFAAEQRLNEMSIRKVLGASAVNILQSFGANFLFLIMIAWFIGALFTYVLADDWLANYAFHISLQLTPFLKAGAIIYLLVSAVILIQFRKLYRINPAQNLRDN